MKGNSGNIPACASHMLYRNIITPSLSLIHTPFTYTSYMYMDGRPVDYTALAGSVAQQPRNVGNRPSECKYLQAPTLEMEPSVAEHVNDVANAPLRDHTGTRTRRRPSGREEQRCSRVTR